MFTIKYRYHMLSPKQSCEGPFYDQNESLHGPFDVVSQFRDESNGIVVQGIKNVPHDTMTFGPFNPKDLEQNTLASPTPRPTVWVMNESGATVARYDL